MQDSNDRLFDMECKDIAAELGLTTPQVKYTLQQALRKIRPLLEDYREYIDYAGQHERYECHTGLGSVKEDRSAWSVPDLSENG